MTLAEICSPTPTSPLCNTWVNATWEEFVAIADDPASDQKTCYSRGQRAEGRRQKGKD